MKKILASALSLSILLAGCGQEEKKEENKGVTKIKKEEVKYISESKLKKDVQKFIDGIVLNLETFNTAASGGGMSDDIPGNFKEVSNQMLSNKYEIEDYIKNNEIKPKDKVNLQYLSAGIENYSNLIKKMAEDMKKVFDGTLSESEFEEKIDKYTNDKESLKVDDDFQKGIKYFENKGVNTSGIEDTLNKLDQQTDETNSNEEDVTSNDEDDPDGDGYSSDLVDSFKVNKTIKAGPTTFSITKVETATEPVTEDNSYEFEGYDVGDEAQLIIVYMKLKNNTEQNADYYPDQDPIITDTGEQLEPASFNLDTGLVTEMKGAIESEGRVVYLLKNSKVKDIKNITFVAGAYLDPETMDEITPEQKIEIPLTK
ncbi:hypothetical protein [Macrococcus animalis]|uniref:hypothetical protein n=1 Tax=Macrococcus animalis TaxID=3395467 RepID=UPI0039BDCBF7